MKSHSSMVTLSHESPDQLVAVGWPTGVATTWTVSVVLALAARSARHRRGGAVVTGGVTGQRPRALTDDVDGDARVVEGRQRVVAQIPARRPSAPAGRRERVGDERSSAADAGDDVASETLDECSSGLDAAGRLDTAVIGVPGTPFRVIALLPAPSRRLSAWRSRSRIRLRNRPDRGDRRSSRSAARVRPRPRERRPSAAGRRARTGRCGAACADPSAEAAWALGVARLRTLHHYGELSRSASKGPWCRRRTPADKPDACSTSRSPALVLGVA